jgi:cytidylate kinase
VDETRSCWLVEVFGKWIDQRIVTSSEYIHRLGKVLLMTARHEHAVFVGRGAQFLLPRERGLMVQIVAPFEMRLKRVMERENMSAAAARRFLKHRDRERRKFVKEHFGRDANDPRLCDLVINLEHLSTEAAVHLIVDACRRRFQIT